MGGRGVVNGEGKGVISGREGVWSMGEKGCGQWGGERVWSTVSMAGLRVLTQRCDTGGSLLV